MFQVVYEYPTAWPEEGPLRVEAQFASEIKVSPLVARRRAGGFLAGHVTMMILAGEPILVLGQARPVWRVPALLHLLGLGEVAQVGLIEVDALTSDVIPPTSEQISAMQHRADALTTRLSRSPTPAN
jgi:hypothetical protein